MVVGWRSELLPFACRHAACHRNFVNIKNTPMRNLIALLVGLIVAILLGWAYMKFSSPMVYVPIETPAATSSSGGSFGSTGNGALFAIVLLCWVTALMSMPGWLAAFFDFVALGLGFMVFMVTGVLVWLAQPSNTLQDSNYVAFLCSIAMIASRIFRILK